MNKEWINIINGYLKLGIEKGYASGFKSLNSKLKFADGEIDYSAADEEAIRNFKLEAFTVAGVGSWELEEELKKIAEKYMRKEIDKDQWELDTRRKMMEFGIGLGSQAPTGWLETNLNNAVVSSISAARWNRLQDEDVKKVYPAYEYKTQRDGHVREEHQLLDGLIYPADDPIWKKIWTPNGCRCRCYITPLTESELSGVDLKPSTTGERKKYIDVVDEDFRRNPGESKSIWGKWLTSKLKEMPSSELQQLKSLLRTYGKTIKKNK